MTPEKQQQLVAELRELPAVTVACLNFRNFKVFNVFAGHAAGDAVVARLQSLLAELSLKSWITGGGEVVAVFAQPLGAARESCRRLSWLFYLRFGVTEAWRIEFADGASATERLLPFRAFDVVCVPRVGLAEIGSDADAAITRAFDHSEEHRRVSSTGDWVGFAPLPTGHWTNLITLAEPLCPRCGGKPEIVDEDLGWSKERCPACAAEYQRHDRIFVDGREQSGGYA